MIDQTHGVLKEPTPEPGKGRMIYFHFLEALRASSVTNLMGIWHKNDKCHVILICYL
jgi:hypothetical protein